MAQRGKGKRTGGGGGFGRGSRGKQSRPYGSVRTAAGGYRARGGPLAVPVNLRPKSSFDPARALGRQALARQKGGNTGAKKGADKSSGAGSANSRSVFRRARPGDFSQRQRGANARARLRNLVRTGSTAVAQRARALAKRVGVRV